MGECPRFAFRNVFCQDGGNVLDDQRCLEAGDDGAPVAGEKPDPLMACGQDEADMSGDGPDEPQVSDSSCSVWGRHLLWFYNLEVMSHGDWQGIKDRGNPSSRVPTSSTQAPNFRHVLSRSKERSENVTVVNTIHCWQFGIFLRFLPFNFDI